MPPAEVARPEVALRDTLVSHPSQRLARARTATGVGAGALLVALGCVRAGKAPAPAGGERCVSGYFEGTAEGGDPGGSALALNLVCRDGTFGGDAFTADGTFRVLAGSFDGGRLRLSVGDERPLLSLDAALDGERLRGRFARGEEAGTFELARQGPARPPPHLDLSTDAWREDVLFFARELPRRHLNAFHSLSRARFDGEIAALERALPRLDGDGVLAGLVRVANLVGDGHTGFRLPPDRPTFPLELRRFGDEVRVVAAGPEAERALGARVVSIDGKSIGEARGRLWPLTPADETPELREERVLAYLVDGALLHGTGVAADRGTARYGFLDDAGRDWTATLRGAPPRGHAGWARVPRDAPLSLLRPGEPFWFSYLPTARTTYVSFRGYDGLAERARALFAEIDHDRPEKLVIDLRHNGGGDNTEGLKHLVEPVRRLSSIDRRGHLYVLVGPATFSAAMNNAAHFRERTSAILVGEPIGERPNSYQEPREVKLPNSGLVLRVSTRYYQFSPGGENVIRPDHVVAPTWREFSAGCDPVLDWVLAAPLG